MFWLTLDGKFGEKEFGWESEARMECRVIQVGDLETIQYYITYKRHLPGSDEDIYNLFTAKYEGYFVAYVKTRIEEEFRNLIDRKKRELEDMQNTTDFQQKQEWLDMQECE